MAGLPRILCCLLVLLSLRSVAQEAKASEPTRPGSTRQPAPVEQTAPGTQATKEKIGSQDANAAGEQAQQAQPSASSPAASPDPVTYAWQLLKAGVRAKKTGTREQAVDALGILRNDRSARSLAEAAVHDPASAVRKAAVSSLGELDAKSSIPQLKSALDDKDPGVVLAAAHALLQLHDKSGYEIYYEILGGERRASPSLVASESSVLKDPKKLAQLGFEEGIGLVPFGGISWRTLKLITRDQSWPVRAAAAKVLGDDPDPASIKTLTQAVDDKNPLVRRAVLQALAHRGDPSVLKTVELYLYDDRDEVKYTAAAAYLRLSAIQQHRTRKSLPTRVQE